MLSQLVEPNHLAEISDLGNDFLTCEKNCSTNHKGPVRPAMHDVSCFCAVALSLYTSLTSTKRGYLPCEYNFYVFRPVCSDCLDLGQHCYGLFKARDRLGYKMGPDLQCIEPPLFVSIETHVRASRLPFAPCFLYWTLFYLCTPPPLLVPPRLTFLLSGFIINFVGVLCPHLSWAKFISQALMNL